VRYFLVDRIEELRRFDYAEGLKAISLSEDVFEQHFPGRPVYPGALLIESMGGALLELSLREERDHCPRCVMSSVKAKFRDFVRPGDLVRLRAEVVSRHDDDAKVKVEGRRGEERVCQAELIYVILRVDDPLLEASRNAFLDAITHGTRFVE
jgi:3-hydroxyacyl-[acyl-carrier-protein] dehydratase